MVDGATVGGHEMGGEPLHDGSAVPHTLLVITAGEENTVTQLAQTVSLGREREREREGERRREERGGERRRERGKTSRSDSFHDDQVLPHDSYVPVSKLHGS